MGQDIEKCWREPTQPEFIHIRDGLPGSGSIYETAWDELVQSHSEPDEYPSSLVFLEHLWKGRLSVCLSEIDEETYNEIDKWINAPERTSRFENRDIHHQDWRKGLKQCRLGINADLVFMSFDPYIYDRHCVRNTEAGNMYQYDLRTIMQISDRWKCPVIMQLSTYSARGNAQREVQAQITEYLVRKGKFSKPVIFRPLTTRRKADNQMMSLVYTRNLQFPEEIESLRKCFIDWLFKQRADSCS
ncbi:MAG: hypothetical protein ACLQPD_24630 [Desulfomonilaceae bacterium]